MAGTLTTPGVFITTGPGRQTFVNLTAVSIISFDKTYDNGEPYLQIYTTRNDFSYLIYESDPAYKPICDWVAKQDICNQANIDLLAANNDLAQENARLRRRVEELELDPGPGPGFLAAAEHFDEMKKQ